MDKGCVVSIHIAGRASEPLLSVSEARAVAGKGLEGDRYFARAGTFSNLPGTGREVTLIESEAVEALKRDYEIELAPGAMRRNVVTRGVALNHLVGREFRVGEVVFEGMRLCEPCDHLEKLTKTGIKRGLVHRGGLRARIVLGGTIHVGDVFEETAGAGAARAS